MNLEHLIKLANRFYRRAEDKDVKLIHQLIDAHLGLKSDGIEKIANTNAPRICLIRHGETSMNSSRDKSQEKLRAWLDLPLVEEGLIQAERLSHYFTAFHISKIISSDLIRAQSVAQAIARRSDVPIYLSPNLRPWDMGVNLQGQSVSKYVPVMLEYIKNEDAVIDGSSESFKTFQRRCLLEIQKAMLEAIEHPERGMIILTAHSRNCRLLKSWILAGAKDINVIDKGPMLAKDDPVITGGFITIEYQNGKWNLINLPNEEVINKA